MCEQALSIFLRKQYKNLSARSAKSLEKMKPLENGKILPRLLTGKDTYLLTVHIAATV